MMSTRKLLTTIASCILGGTTFFHWFEENVSWRVDTTTCAPPIFHDLNDISLSTNSSVFHTAKELSLSSSSTNSSSIPSLPLSPLLMSAPTSKWEFVPFPHQPLPVGNEAVCNWAKYHLETTMDDDKKENETNTANNNTTMDAIQRAAYQEGICQPTTMPVGVAGLHVFSTAEAIQCLSGASRIAFTGDSYTRQLFIGMRDILLGDPNRTEIPNSTVRERLLKVSEMELGNRRKIDRSFPKINYVCYQECYGKPLGSEIRPFEEACSNCLNQKTLAKDPSTTIWVGAGIHIHKFHADDTEATIQAIRDFLNRTHKVTWISMPSYDGTRYKLPELHRNASTHSTMVGHQLYRGMLQATRDYHHSFLDVFHLTESCNDDACTLDGNHRTRFVNRWKAQLALNMMCKRVQ